MRDLDFSKSEILADWADTECQHLDLVASWENLVSVYSYLDFKGPETDAERLEEFKFVIGELNKFLTRMKNGLDKTSSIEGAVEFLGTHMNTSDMGAVKTRQSVAYNKLKQRWIAQAVATLLAAISQIPEEGEEADD